ncbi:DUF4136 domain-containing protein [Emcibacter sp.]|uniref:DUF4136 domain-containing protein n=1 Tax=Emcibacter sp. TaxID=1979954 RepID=UPI002AA65A76|nr:DUF4136 domain-containing protein [Emcibacter sp.]
MRNVIKTVFALCLLGMLSACANTFTSDVTSFHSLSRPTGEKIVIVPMDESLQGSLEFATYANILGNELGKLGYKPAAGGTADLIVELDYGVDDGKVFVRTFGGFYPHSYWDWGFYDPYYYGYYSYYYRPYWPYRSPWMYGGFHHRPEVQSYVKYNRILKVNIRPNFEGAKNIYEGRVEGIGRSKDLTELVPLMIRALFQNFPGTSGTTQKVVLDLDK